MNNVFFLGRVFILVALIFLKPQISAASENPAVVTPNLKRIVLSTGGVGYFEYQAEIRGPSEIQTAVPLNQVDDILKSLVVYDPANQVEDIRLPSKEPLSAFFHEQRFDSKDLQDPAALLSSLRGAEIIIELPRKIVGRLMAIQPEVATIEDGKQTITRHRLSVMTSQGLQQAILEQVDNVRFTDPNLNNQLQNALKVVFDNNAQDRRLLRLNLGGDQKRMVRFGYTIEAPLWKTSYRLTTIDANTAALQGWAILENLSGVPWVNVDLSLISGNPVALKQALYDSYFIPRPQIPVEIPGRFLPKPDQGSIAFKAARSSSGSGANAPMAAKLSAGNQMESDMAYESPMADVATTNFANLPQSSDLSAQIYFQFPKPASVESGGSLVLPIIQQTIPAKAVSWFQPATNLNHPLSAVRLMNDGKTSFPPGLVTLYARTNQSDISFVGDAQMTSFAVGDERLLNFAIDQKVMIEQENQADETVTTASFVDGLLYLSTLSRQQTIYRIKNLDKKPRTLVIDHPRTPGWEMVEPKGASITLTDQSWRVAIDVPANQTIEQKIVVAQPIQQQFEMTSLDGQQLRYYASSQTLSPEIRAVFARLAQFKAEWNDAETQQQNLESQKNGIVEEQERLRRLLGSVPSGTDLYKRYVNALNTEEDKLQDLRKKIDNALEVVDKARIAMLNYARESQKSLSREK
jgi:hypothetical protein